MSPVTFDKDKAPVAAPKAAAAPAPAAAPKPVLSAAAEVVNLRTALELLKTSSNATLGGTIVFDAVQLFEKAITNLESALKK